MQNKMIYGYKCFNKGLVNSYGGHYQVGKTYTVDGDIIFGVHGLHMCLRLEDTLRFFDTFNEEISICEVIGFGEYNKRDDEYNDYYDMYAFRSMYIVRELERKDIILYGLNLLEMPLVRFISSLKLDDNEKEMFREKFHNNYLVNQYLDYYQDNKKDAFERRLIKNK